MKILIKLCLLCLVSFIGISATPPPTIISRNMTATYVGKQGNKDCYFVKMKTSVPVYSINIANSKTCYNTTTCSVTLCFQGNGFDDTYHQINCSVKATVNSSAYFDGCTVVVGPG